MVRNESLATTAADFDPFAAAKKLVLDSVSSPLTRSMYAVALEDFFTWHAAQGRPPFTRATVMEFRNHLQAAGLAPSSVNQKLSALRKLAAESVYAGWLDANVGQAIRDVK